MAGTDNLKRKIPKVSFLNKQKRFTCNRRTSSNTFFGWFGFLKKI